MRLYPRFSDEEHARRGALGQRLMAEAGVDALVVHGNGNARHDLQFFTGFPARQDCFLVHTVERPPVLFVQLENHLPNAREMAVLDRVEWGGLDSTASVASELRERGARRVGVIGSPPFQQHARLVKALDGVELVDATPAFRRARLVKSEEEIEWTRGGAHLCDAGIEALVAEARPGMHEYELGALVEHAYGRLGGGHGICFLATAPMAGGGRYVPAQNWSRRVVEPGDAILIELSAGVGGYTGQVLRTIAVGAEPPAAYRALHDVAEEAFERIFAAARPGASSADLVAAGGIVEERGYSICDDLVHGYGGGYLEPILRTPATMHRPVPDIVLEPGMMLVIQPNVVTPDLRMGVQTGELILITADGAESLHAAPRGLLRAAA